MSGQIGDGLFWVYHTITMGPHSSVLSHVDKRCFLSMDFEFHTGAIDAPNRW
jgi:hypothetical protein